MLVCRAAVKKRWNPDQGHHQVLGGTTTIIILGIQLVAKKCWPFLACFRGASGWWFLSFVSTLEGYSPVQLLLIIVCLFVFIYF